MRLYLNCSRFVVGRPAVMTLLMNNLKLYHQHNNNESINHDPKCLPLLILENNNNNNNTPSQYTFKVNRIDE